MKFLDLLHQIEDNLFLLIICELIERELAWTPCCKLSLQRQGCLNRKDWWCYETRGTEVEVRENGRN